MTQSTYLRSTLADCLPKFVKKEQIFKNIFRKEWVWSKKNGQKFTYFKFLYQVSVEIYTNWGTWKSALGIIAYKIA